MLKPVLCSTMLHGVEAANEAHTGERDIPDQGSAPSGVNRLVV
jgi:hypothetical protein